MGKLQGKIAVITGGTEGIGLATAQLFVKEGAYVFITGRRQKELDEAVTAIGSNVTGVLLELHANDQRGRNDGGTGTSASFGRLQSGADTTGLRRIGGDLL